MKHYKSLAAASLALLLLAACGSSGIGDILGGGNGGNGANGNYEIRGTVDSVDLSNRSIYLTNVSGYNTSMLSNGGGSAVRVYYDANTPVDYQGQSYRPQDLERGDQISVRVDESGNTLVAQSVSVLYDATNNNGSSYPTGNYPNGSYTTSIRGTVRSIDTSRRTIEVDRGYGSTVLVDFSTNTPVYWNNQSYRVSDLERGDEVDIRTTDLGNGRYSAQDINVLRSISSNNNGTYNNGSSNNGTYNNVSTIRGTVRSVDLSRRTIQLDSANWISGFNTNAGTGVNSITVQFPSNAQIEMSGRAYPLSGLERGDVIEVEVTNANSSLPLAQRILLVRDVNSR
ncbi:MAG: hypothetical protein JO197_24080 [Acidobacteria bacterium]|nr:hypothetical protein [Acidobacteriota bacterium]MBV9474934.1 hypothetical protein [Acidobacteriota bacterium]